MSPREITPDDRIYDLEEGAKKHASSISALVMDHSKVNETLGDHNRRLTAQNEAIVLLRTDIIGIQEARRARQLEEVRREERDTAHREALDLRLKAIEESIKSIYSLGKWFSMTAGAAVILVIVTYFSKGGFTVVPH